MISHMLRWLKLLSYTGQCIFYQSFHNFKLKLTKNVLKTYNNMAAFKQSVAVSLCSVQKIYHLCYYITEDDFYFVQQNWLNVPIIILLNKVYSWQFHQLIYWLKTNLLFLVYYLSNQREYLLFGLWVAIYPIDPLINL